VKLIRLMLRQEKPDYILADLVSPHVRDTTKRSNDHAPSPT